VASPDHGESAFNRDLVPNLDSPNWMKRLTGTSYVSISHELVEMAGCNVHKDLPESRWELE
jgi:hypothetical protein